LVTTRSARVAVPQFWQTHSRHGTPDEAFGTLGTGFH
jgi:hypothetical protein